MKLSWRERKKSKSKSRKDRKETHMIESRSKRIQSVEGLGRKMRRRQHFTSNTRLRRSNDAAPTSRIMVRPLST
jgi:hypothetical protein